MCCEGRLGGSAAQKLFEEEDDDGPSSHECQAWLGEWQRMGLVEGAGNVRTVDLNQSAIQEPAHRVVSEYHELVLRQLNSRGELNFISRCCGKVFAEHSRAGLALALQTGDSEELRRWTLRQSEPQPPGALPLAVGKQLWSSVCNPFDARWFESTWNTQSWGIALAILEDSLRRLSSCTPLYQWARDTWFSLTAAEASATPQEEERTQQLLEGLRILSEHAVFRGEAELLSDHWERLPISPRLALQAAARFQTGDQTEAQRLIDESLAFENRAASPSWLNNEEGLRQRTLSCTSVNPMLALLLCSRQEEAGKDAAKRLTAVSRAGAPDSGAGKAIRTLLRYMAEREAEHVRLDVHQLPEGAGPWEYFVLGVTVHLHLHQEWTRASWSKQLLQLGMQWLDIGYSWFGRQCLFLAEQLSGNFFAEAYHEAATERHLPPLQQYPGELLLCEVIAPREEWEKALSALDELADDPELSSDGRYRVAWYVDMATATLARPALQEYREGSDGWTKGRRTSITKLYERLNELPAEDVAVLRCTRPVSPDRREYTPEAFEALIGHERVLNGARGDAQIRVVAGKARVETEEDGEYLTVLAHPPNAELGVNVIAEDEYELAVYRVTAAMQRVMEILPHNVRIPQEHQSKALAVLAKLSQGVEVRSRHLGQEKTVVADSAPCLRISPNAGAWLVQAGVRPFGEKGRFFPLGMGAAALSATVEGQRLRCERDFETERERLVRLRELCPTLRKETEEDSAGQSWVLGEGGVLDLLVELKQSGERCELEWPESPAIRLRSTVTSAQISGSLKREKGWYLAAGSVQLDDVTQLALKDLLAMPSLHGGRFIRLPNGDYVELERRVRQVVAALNTMEPVKGPQAAVRIHDNALHVLGTLAASDSGFTLDEESRSWVNRLSDVRSSHFPSPPGLTASLRPYQQEGFEWLACLLELGLGGCLADDMGLGKTIQILATLLHRKDLGPALVVAPTSVCINWVLEMSRFAQELTAIEYVGNARRSQLDRFLADGGAGKVVICSYTLMQQDVDALQKVRWGTMVLDEAQFIKNAQSKRARAAWEIPALGRIAATGTPVENHLGDLWSIFQFLNPGLFGSQKSFAQRFSKPGPTSEGNSELLREMVRPYILRRTKSEVLKDLPPLTNVRHEVLLSEAETQRYDLLRQQIHRKLTAPGTKRQNKLEILAEITRLRRFCCHPKLVFPEAGYEAAKITTFLDLVTELMENEHRALVFSQFVDFLSLVREQLDERQVPYQYLDGSTSKTARQAAVDNFQNGTDPLFLISLKAGGFGLNLTAADYVIHLDPWWNPAVEAQATDRAHRIGQERPVTVYRLVTKDTIEENILKLHDDKRKVAESLLQGGEKAGKLSVAQLVALIEQGAPQALEESSSQDS